MKLIMKKKKFLILGILGMLLLILVGGSYAIWQITLQQTEQNVITTGCFKVEFNDKNPIHLDKAYPINDEEGSSLVPYEFTITNTCNSYASYQINLEILNTTTLENLDYLKVMLDDKANILTENEVVTKTLENAKTSYKLESGYLRENKSKTFSLRLWMDEETPTSEEFMNKMFESKITVIATYKENLDNNIEANSVSQNTAYSDMETFQIHVTSENYDLVAMSDDLETWEELETKGKEITVEKTVTANGTYTYYFQDEAENIQEVTVLATKIDDKKPIANMSVTKENNIIKIDASGSKDNETSIAKYYYSKDGVNFSESLNNSYEFPIFDYGMATKMLEDYKNQKVYMKVEDEYQNISDVKEHTFTVNELLYDETADNNLRYVGANPNNYVWFGATYKTAIYDLYNASLNRYFGLSLKSLAECENIKKTSTIGSNPTCVKTKNASDPILWRIIGVFNHIQSNQNDTLGSTRIKLIREDSIGAYSWDSSASSINSGYGVNEWSQATLKTLLNDYYYNKKVNQTCYICDSYTSLSCSFNEYGLESNLKPLISEALWKLGSNGKTFAYNNIKTKQFYTLERGSNSCKICTSGAYCNDSVSRTSTWVGKVGLMYPSDYGYATSGGSTTNRTTCLDTKLFNWGSFSDCSSNSWIYNGNPTWTMMPLSDSERSDRVFGVYDGYVGFYNVRNGMTNFGTWVRPTVYLNSEVKITGGNGSLETPFILSF